MVQHSRVKGLSSMYLCAELGCRKGGRGVRQLRAPQVWIRGLSLRLEMMAGEVDGRALCRRE